jgi:predicted nuclease of predicted toxin-antitoxin system
MLWLDNHIAPSLARSIAEVALVPCRSIRDIGLARASDEAIFESALANGVLAIVTKDRDFAQLVARRGPPPAIIHVVSGNTSKSKLGEALANTLPSLLAEIRRGAAIVLVG